jgi:hypothetical protein
MARNRRTVNDSRFLKAMRERRLQFYRDHARLPNAAEQKALVVALWREILGSDGVHSRVF